MFSDNWRNRLVHSLFLCKVMLATYICIYHLPLVCHRIYKVVLYPAQEIAQIAFSGVTKSYQICCPKLTDRNLYKESMYHI